MAKRSHKFGLLDPTTFGNSQASVILADRLNRLYLHDRRLRRAVARLINKYYVCLSALTNVDRRECAEELLRWMHTMGSDDAEKLPTDDNTIVSLCKNVIDTMRKEHFRTYVSPLESTAARRNQS